LLNDSLTQAQTWGIPGIFAAVNDFRLPNNSWDKNNLENTTRWTSFRNKYAGVTSGQRVDIEMQPNLSENSEPDLLKKTESQLSQLYSQKYSPGSQSHPTGN